MSSITTEVASSPNVHPTERLNFTPIVLLLLLLLLLLLFPGVHTRRARYLPFTSAAYAICSCPSIVISVVDHHHPQLVTALLLAACRSVHEAGSLRVRR